MFFFFCECKAHVSCPFKKYSLSVLFLGVLCILGMLKLHCLSCKYFSPFVSLPTCHSKNFIVVNVVWGVGEIKFWVIVRKVFPPQVIEEFIYGFFRDSQGLNFTFTYLTHLEFTITHVRNNWFKLIFLYLSQYNLYTNSSFHPWIEMALVS